MHPSERIDLTNLIKAARSKQMIWQERYKIKSDLVFFIDLGQEFLYRMSLKDTKVIRFSEKKLKKKSMKYLEFLILYLLLF